MRDEEFRDLHNQFEREDNGDLVLVGLALSAVCAAGMGALIASVIWWLVV